MTLKTVIVDDEPLAIQLLSSILRDISGITIVAQCNTGNGALEAVLAHDADLLFLDIHMPELNGFDVIRNLQSDCFPMIIFTTAYSEYAASAFELNAVDYILKPLDEDRVDLAVRKAIQQRPFYDENQNRKLDLIHVLEALSGKVSEGLGNDEEPTKNEISAEQKALCLSVKQGGNIRLVLKSDINWVEAAGDYICVHTDDATYTMRSTMKEVESKLNAAQFQRIHRSTIVNLSRICELTPLPKGEAFIRLSNDKLLKVSRNYRDLLRENFA